MSFGSLLPSDALYDEQTQGNTMHAWKLRSLTSAPGGDCSVTYHPTTDEHQVADAAVKVVHKLFPSSDPAVLGGEQ